MARTYDRFLRERLTRRRLLAGAGGAALGAAALAACDGGGGETGNGQQTPGVSPTASEEEVTKGGILRLQQPANVPLPSMSPFGPTALISSLIFGFTTYDHLWYVPIDTGEVELMLASNFEMVDEQGLETVVTLHDTVYHDKPPVSGRPVLARDVPPSWEAFRDDPFGLGREWLRDIMESVTAPDERTVVIRQNRPFAWMFGPSAASSPASSSILPAETLDDSDLLARDVIGSGRFFLESHRNGENPKLRAFPNWRIPGEPFLGGIDFILITESTAAQAQFRAGSLDQVNLANPVEVDQMMGQLGDQMTISEELSRTYASLMLKYEPPFDDERVRHGINLAINRNDMIQLVELDQAAGVPSGIVPPAHVLYALDEDDPDLQEYFRHDPTEARQLLEQAGFPFDREFTLKFPSPGEEVQKRAQVLQEQLGEVGVRIRLEPEDLLTVWLARTLNQGEFEMTLFTHLAYEDPYFPLAFYTNFSPVGPQDPERGRNNMGYFDDEVIAAVDEANRELDLGARIEKVKEAQRVIMRKWAPMINLYSGVTFTARRHWYKGWISGRGSFGLFNGRAWIDTRIRGS